MTSSLWLAGLERELQEHLSSTNTTQMANIQHVHNVATRQNHIQRQRQSYNSNMEQVLKLLEEIKGNLEQAKGALRSAVRLPNPMIHSRHADAGLDDQEV